MRYNKTFTLNGREVLFRNGEREDGAEVLAVFNRTHAETDYLLSYPDENSLTAESGGEFLRGQADSSNAIELLAIADGKIVGSAGIEAVGGKYKLRHRADFGIAVLKEYWGLGIGRKLTELCIEAARDAGYSQIELQAVAENVRAVEMYKKCGFVEYGRNPRGFNSRESGYQELVYMKLELK